MSRTINKDKLLDAIQTAIDQYTDWRNKELKAKPKFYDQKIVASHENMVEQLIRMYNTISLADKSLRFD